MAWLPPVSIQSWCDQPLPAVVVVRPAAEEDLPLAVSAAGSLPLVGAAGPAHSAVALTVLLFFVAAAAAAAVFVATWPRLLQQRPRLSNFVADFFVGQFNPLVNYKPTQPTCPLWHPRNRLAVHILSEFHEGLHTQMRL
jgi:hypothetical protein